VTILIKRIVGAALCGLLLASCASTDSAPGGSGDASPAGGGTLRIAIQDTPNTLDPLLAANTTESMISRLSFDLLVTADETGKPVPDLAETVPTQENGGISADGLTITYHLRKGVTWHDGEPFTSKDVKFSYDAVMNTNNNIASRVGYEVVKSIDLPDDATIVFHLKRKFAPFVDTVFGESDDPYCIVPEHILGKYHDINQVPFNQEPIGTGPFRVTKWVRGDHIELVANDAYFQGKPKVRAITIRFIPNENTEINALRAHEIDWLFQASPNLYRTIKTIPGITPVLVSLNQIERIQINNKRPGLDDVRVRKAIALAIDREAMVAKFTDGSALVASQDLPPFMWAHDASIKPYAYDPAQAKALLAQAGYHPGPDGIMAKGATRLSFVLVYNQSNATRALLAVQVQEYLKKIGIEAQIKTYPSSLAFAPYGMGGIYQTGKFDLNISGWVAGIDPDNHSQYTCNTVPPGGNNYDRFCNPTVDAAEAAAITTYPRDERKKDYATIEQTLAANVPEAWIWNPRQVHAIVSTFKNFKPNPVSEPWNAWQWEI
jgi:peptide/nickel transport system substrate-binding protein